MEIFSEEVKKMENDLKLARKLFEKGIKTNFKKAEDVWILTILRSVRDSSDRLADDFEEWKRKKLGEIE